MGYINWSYSDTVTREVYSLTFLASQPPASKQPKKATWFFFLDLNFIKKKYAARAKNYLALIFILLLEEDVYN
jgi:hypothetical protein